MATTSQPTTTRRTSTGRLYLIFGVLIAVLGPALYVAQFSAKVWSVPWYMPIVTTFGVALVALALMRRVSVTRVLGILLGGLLAAFEWYFLLSMTVVPPYTGPMAVGSPFPEFTTRLADGSQFTQADLKGTQNHAIVLFRGRW